MIPKQFKHATTLGEYTVDVSSVRYTIKRKKWYAPTAGVGWQAIPEGPENLKTIYADTLEDLAYNLGLGD